MSASGPRGVISFGVWQSWQPPPMISSLPRSIWAWPVSAAGAVADGTTLTPGAASFAGRLHPESATTTGTQASSATRRCTTRIESILLNETGTETRKHGILYHVLVIS